MYPFEIENNSFSNILAKRLPQMVANGEIGAHSKIPVKLMTRYGVQAMNHNEMVIKATLANLHSALFKWEENNVIPKFTIII